jgi:aryl-alcohol dehydrogenase-like predicted oxidoreductase
MKYNRLGTSGLVVSKLTFGGGSLGVGTNVLGLRKDLPQKTADEVVARCLDAGVTSFDTSDDYLFGQSEAVLGKALGVRRKEVILATKTSTPWGPREKNMGGLSYRRMIEACDASLKRMGTDWFDIYYCHGPDRDTPMQESMRAWEYLVTSGRVRYAAVSNYAAWQAAHMLGLQAKANFSPMVCNQVYYSMLSRNIERDLVPLSRETGLGIIGFEALAGGFLTGKYTRENPRPTGTRGAQFTGEENTRELFPGARRSAGRNEYDLVDVLKEMAPRYNCTVAQLTLAWTLSKPWLHSVIFGVTKMEQVIENLAAIDIKLAEEDIAKIDKMTVPPA